MGLGEFFRNLSITQTDTVTGATRTDLVVTGTGAFPSWYAGGTGHYRGAMGIAGAWRASILLSELVGRLPWFAYRQVGDGPALRLPTPSLLDTPAPPETRIETFAAFALDLLFHGNAIGLWAQRDATTGYPTAILPVSAERVNVKRVAAGDPLPLPVGALAYQVGGRWYSADDVFHVRGPKAPGELRGMGVLECHLRQGTLDLAAALTDQARGIAASSVPSLKVNVLNPDMTPEEAAELKAQIMVSQRTRSPIVLTPVVDVTPISWNPTETQLIDARKMSLHETALIFGLDPSWLGVAVNSQVYASIEQEGLKFLRHSAGGWIARFEQALSAALPRGQWVEANLDSELRPDTLTRYQAHGLAITNGIMTRDEVRAIENLPPLTAAQRDEVLPPAPAPAAQPANGATSQADVALARVQALSEGELSVNELRAVDAWWDGLTEQERANYAADGAQLKEYWLAGPGLAKWATSPHPWTALYHYLLKYLTPERAKRTAAQWFHDHFGYWPGDRGGDNPVGKG